MGKNLTIQKLFLPALILLTPFLVFLKYNSSCVTCPESLAVVGGIVCIALIFSTIMLISGWKVSAFATALLIAGFVDLQFTPWESPFIASAWFTMPSLANAWFAIILFIVLQSFVLCLFLKERFVAIATAVFATFFLVTSLQLASSHQKEDFLFIGHKLTDASAPRIIHLILDEHIGIEGIPVDIEGAIATKRLIKQFYLKNGFQLFGGAFSRHSNTLAALPAMLQFSPDTENVRHEKSANGFAMTHNEYFQLLANRRYSVAVLSSNFFDLCANQSVVVICRYYRGTLNSLTGLAINFAQKLQVIVLRYLRQSSLFSALIRRYGLNRDPWHRWVWAYDLDRTGLHSLNVLRNLNSLWDTVLSLPQGAALLAHLMLPHSPYVMRADCSVRETGEDFLWLHNNKFVVRRGDAINTIESRELRYEHYFEQLQCLYSRFDELFNRMRAAGIYDDSIILIHGDHGSRIAINEPIIGNQHKLTKQDLLDGFSTLFAVKLPGQSGSYDQANRPLEELFADFASDAGLAPALTVRAEFVRYVYLTSKSGRPRMKSVRVRYPSPELGP